MYPDESDEELFKGKYRIKSTRLSGWDYSVDGYYFVTICTKDCVEYFGEIKNEIMGLFNIGCIATKYWNEIPDHFNNVKLDEFIIMPNHVHGILVIDNGYEQQRRDVALQRLYRGKCPQMSNISPKSKSLSTMIRSFKSIVTKTINIKYPEINFQWQSRFHDHIIRNNKSLNKIREYIKYNPQKWGQDRNNKDGLWM